MNALEVVRAAIPNADAALAHDILWSRTPFPIGRVSVRELYIAADRVRRAGEHKLRLCEFCDRKAEGQDTLCRICARIFRHGGSHDDSRGTAERPPAL